MKINEALDKLLFNKFTFIFYLIITPFNLYGLYVFIKDQEYSHYHIIDWIIFTIVMLILMLYPIAYYKRSKTIE